MFRHPFLSALGAAILFGAATPLSKPLLEYLSSYQLAGLLYLGAAIGVAPSNLRLLDVLPYSRMGRRNQARLAGAVFFGGVLAPLFLLGALQVASAASVSMWLPIELVATAVLGVCFFREHLGRSGWWGVGAAALAGSLLALGEPAGWWAGLLVTLSCFCWGLDNHLTARIDGILPVQSVFVKGLGAGSVNLLIGMQLHPLDTALWVPLAALVIGMAAYGVSIVLYVSAAQQIGAIRSQMIFASSPLFGVLLSALLLGESILWAHGAAALLLLCSVVFLFRDRHAHAHSHEPTVHAHMHRHDDGHHGHSHPGLPPSARHSHWHEHERLAHSHPHWPDLHHRHSHEEKEPASGC